MRLRRFFVMLSFVAIVAGGCTNRPARVEGVTYSLIPGPTVTVTVAPVSIAPPSALAPETNRVAQPAQRAVGSAAYSIGVGCVQTTRRQDGRTESVVQNAHPRPVQTATRLTYDFAYRRETSGNPAVRVTKRCTVKTQRTRTGVEPRVAVTLGCTGEATYTANPLPTSAEAHSWRHPSDLLSGYTHVMMAPKSAEQLSETVSCTISVVRR